MFIRYPLLAVGLLCTTVALAEDWPQWRGPNRDGLNKETGLLKSWPKDGPPKIWTAKNLGLGWGTPSVADGKIFGIGTRDGKDGVWALKESDSKELWFTPFSAPAAGLLKQTNGPASTPTFSNNNVYTVSANGTVSCMNATTGKLAWTKSYVSDFGGSVPLWGFSDSVLADGDKIICVPCGDKGSVAALKADSGEVVWAAKLGKLNTSKEGGAGYSSPVKAMIGGVPMYVVLLDAANGVVGLHADTGKLLWKYNGKGASGGVAQIPTPIVRDDRVWVSCSYSATTGGAALLQIESKGNGAFEAKEIKSYAKPQLNNHHGGMVLVGDYVYFGHDQNKGYPVCVDFKTGDIKWGPVTNKAEVGGGDGSAGVLFADGRLYFRYQNGVLVLIEPSPEDLKVVSSFQLPPPDVKSYPQSWPHPVIANGKLYIRDQNVMHCYDVKADKN